MRQVSRLGTTRAIGSTLLAVCLLGSASIANATEAPSLPVLPEVGLFAVFETTLGSFACELEYEQAPVTVGNFVGLAQGTQEFLDPRNKVWVRRPFYDGLKFHRVIQEFVIQGGDPLGDGTGGPGYTFLDEFSSELQHDRPGVLSMANSGPATNGSQFFVTLKAAPQLNNRHSVFGRVVVGMEVVETIAAQRLMGRRRSTPVTDIVINKLTIVRHGDAANAFDATAAFARQAEIIAQRARDKQERSKEFHREMERAMASATTTESGMKYVVLTSGNGKPARPGDMVTVHYVGYLEDGSQFDSSYERNAPFRFPVGNGHVIKGWDEVFLLMMVGEKARVVIPPELAYGQQGKRRYGIPPGATLVFDVELVDIFRP